MLRSFSTKKSYCTVFVLTLLCCLGQHIVVSKANSNAPLLEALYEYDASARLMESKPAPTGENNKGKDKNLTFLFALLGFLFTVVVARIPSSSPQKELLPHLSDFHGMLPFPCAPPSSALSS